MPSRDNRANTDNNQGNDKDRRESVQDHCAFPFATKEKKRCASRATTRARYAQCVKEGARPARKSSQTQHELQGRYYQDRKRQLAITQNCREQGLENGRSGHARSAYSTGCASHCILFFVRRCSPIFISGTGVPPVKIARKCACHQSPASRPLPVLLVGDRGCRAVELRD